MKKIVLLAFVLVLLSTTVVVALIRPVEAGGTIIIKADGSVEGTTHITTVDNVTYSFTGNIYADIETEESAIVVEKDNIVVDGAGYSLEGTEERSPKGTGISLVHRENVAIKNLIIREFFIGITLDYCTNIAVSGNEIKNNGHGIWLFRSSDNIISGNNIERVGTAILLFYSSNNSICGNIVSNNYIGIDLGRCCNSNRIYGNTITSSSMFSLGISHSLNNIIYHNDIVGELYIENTTNIWDDGAGRGNYWGLYFGVDQDGDGIGDTPCVIDENNQDNYPLMSPLSPQITEVPFWMQWWFWAIIATGIVVLVGIVYFLKKRKPPTPTTPTLPTEGTIQKTTQNTNH